MSVISIRSERASRGERMLRTALGSAIADWLDDAAVIEVMLNPDGRLWIDRLGEGISNTGVAMSAADGERIIRLVAHHVGVEVHSSAPRVLAELPEGGERFEGLLPPIVAAPSFAIRKPAVAVFTLSDYVAAGIMAASEAEFLAYVVAERQNILVAGGTSTGKTTLTNALLAEVANTQDRVVLIEDTRELQCAAPNLVALRTKALLRFPILSVRPCACARTASRLAKSGARKRSTCSRLWEPAIREGSEPSMQEPRSERSRGSNS
jgi:type IV secretion system protein TrbB